MLEIIQRLKQDTLSTDDVVQALAKDILHQLEGTNVTDIQQIEDVLYLCLNVINQQLVQEPMDTTLGKRKETLHRYLRAINEKRQNFIVASALHLYDIGAISDPFAYIMSNTHGQMEAKVVHELLIENGIIQA